MAYGHAGECEFEATGYVRTNQQLPSVIPPANPPGASAIAETPRTAQPSAETPAGSPSPPPPTPPKPVYWACETCGEGLWLDPDLAQQHADTHMGHVIRGLSREELQRWKRRASPPRPGTPPNKPGRYPPERPHGLGREKWLVLYFTAWIVLVWVTGTASPLISPRDLIVVSLFNSGVLVFFVYGIAGLGRRGVASKVFAILLIILLVGVAYVSEPQLTNTSSGTATNFFSTEASSLDSVWPNPSPSEGTQPSGSRTTATVPVTSSLTTSLSVSQQTTIKATSNATSLVQRTSSTSQVVLADPDIANGEANITYPADYSHLVQYALNLINNDRNQNGLSNVTLSAIPSGQQHSDSMVSHGYFSHWDVQGFKPYMRYTLLGGTGAVSENLGLDYCTYSPPSASSVSPTDCTTQTMENALANSEYGMMYNDAVCCNNGHRDNILDPLHNRVSIGIAYDAATSAVYFTEDFENYYINLNSPIVSSGYQVSLTGAMLASQPVSQITVFFDPTPQPMSIQQLEGTLSYDPGTFVGGVFPPCSTDCQYYPGETSVYASAWNVGSNSVDIAFSLDDFVTANGPGVYTIYLQTGDSTATAITTYSVFVS